MKNVITGSIFATKQTAKPLKIFKKIPVFAGMTLKSTIYGIRQIQHINIYCGSFTD